MMQPDLFTQPRKPVKRGRYPHKPGTKTDDRTTQEAAAKTAFVVHARHARILALVFNAGKNGLTADECADYLGMRPDQVRPRFSELRAMGKIFDTGEQRANAHGNKMIVWRLA